MRKRVWMGVVIAAAGLVAATVLQSLADESHRSMMQSQMQSQMHSQMHGGHDQGEQDEHSAHYLKHLLKHAKEIGLTSEQIRKVKALQLDFNRTQARMEADIKIAGLELHALLEEEQAELPVIQAKVDQLKKTEGALLLAAIKSKREAMTLLTPDQREKDRAYREQMKRAGEVQHRGGMGGMGHGGMSGGGAHGTGEQGGGGHQH